MPTGKRQHFLDGSSSQIELEEGRTVAGRATENHIGGLDGLRAVAALAVFGVHFNQVAGLEAQLGPIDVARVLARGDHGVLLFFTLSGFLLSQPYWRALAAGDALPDLRVYALRRAARIVPAYYVVLTALILASGIWRVPAAMPDLLLHYVFAFNYTEFSIFSINPPFWTLAVEMQFYLLLPLLFMGLHYLNPNRVLASILTLCAVAYASHYWLVTSIDRIVEWPFNPWLTWIRPYGAVLTHSLLAHLPHFLFGVAAGWAFTGTLAAAQPTSRRSEVANEVLFWLCAALASLLVVTGLGERVGVPFGRYGFPVVPALVAIMILAAPQSRFARTCLESAPLRLTGVISYGIYIYHVPCLNIVDRIMLNAGFDAPDHWMMFGGAGLGLTLIAATLSYLVIERPVLRLVRKYHRTGASSS